MKALILNGAERDDNTLNLALETMVAELKGFGWEVSHMPLREMEIADCLGCFRGWTETPGVCIIDDAARDVARTMIQSDLLVFLTPVVFGGYSPELKKTLDRSISNLSPFFVTVNGEVHHKLRYEKMPILLVVGVQPNHDEESEQIFKTMAERNARNMYPPAHACAVVRGDQEPEQIEAEVKALFDKVGVRK